MLSRTRTFPFHTVMIYNCFRDDFCPRSVSWNSLDSFNFPHLFVSEFILRYFSILSFCSISLKYLMENLWYSFNHINLSRFSINRFFLKHIVAVGKRRQFINAKSKSPYFKRLEYIILICVCNYWSIYITSFISIYFSRFQIWFEINVVVLYSFSYFSEFFASFGIILLYLRSKVLEFASHIWINTLL